MSINNKQWLGLPLNLLWGYIAIAVFMTGDGFELAFLSHYIKALGFSPAGLLCLYPLRHGRRAVGVDFRRGGGNYHPAENDDDWLRTVVRVPRAVPRFRPRSRQLCADPDFLRHPRLRLSAVPLLVYRGDCP